MKRSKMGIVLVSLGIVLVITGIAVIYNNSFASNAEGLSKDSSDQPISAPDSSVSNRIQKESSKQNEERTISSSHEIESSKNDNSSSDGLTDNEQKGLAFEKWVINHFPKQYYKLIDWKGDKIVDGRYPESSRYPDLEFELQLHGGKITERFSVECKWRKSFYHGKINWASQEKIAIYNDYAKERNQAVFLVLGVGGEPDSPELVYIIPLVDAQQSELKENDIERFRRNNKNKEFYYYAKENELR